MVGDVQITLRTFAAFHCALIGLGVVLLAKVFVPEVLGVVWAIVISGVIISTVARWPRSVVC